MDRQRQVEEFGSRSGRVLRRMTVIVWLVLLFAAALEVGGDLAIRRGMERSRWWLIGAGMLVLGLYGYVVNRSHWDFSKLFGVYVAFFAVVAVLTGRFYLHEHVPPSTWLGLALIVTGGLVIQFGRG